MAAGEGKGNGKKKPAEKSNQGGKDQMKKSKGGL
jgi:hypothetical protein